MKRKSTCILVAGMICSVAMFVLLYKIDCCIGNSFCCVARILESKLSTFCCNIMDAFYVIWGMTITIVLFVLELGNSNIYGVRLKKIIELSLDGVLLALCAIGYLLLCPIVYFFHSIGRELVCIWGNICVFVTFSVTVAYIIYKTNPTQIKKLLIQATEEEVKKIARKSQKRKENTTLQQYVEGLPITDMIKHIDYNNDKEIQFLIEALDKTMTNIVATIKGTEYEHLVIMTWINNIIETSGLTTEREKKQTEYVLMNVIDTVISKGEITKEMISRTVQILCPLIERGTDGATEVFYSLWNKVNFFQKYVIWFLCLYEEYLYFQNEEQSREHLISLELVGQDRAMLPMCVALWNKEYAWEFWRSWVTMREKGNNLAMSVFFAFCNDVEQLKKGKYNNINSHVMRRYYWRTR